MLSGYTGHHFSQLVRVINVLDFQKRELSFDARTKGHSFLELQTILHGPATLSTFWQVMQGLMQRS